MDKIYSRVNWKNEPSTETPVNAENLNKMDSAIDTLDTRVVSLDSDKYVKPSGGIPKTDLASAVQTSLGKADSAVPNTRKVNGKTLSADITINSTEIPHGDSNVGAEIDKIGNDATLSSSATGNPLKLSSTSAPIIDFKVDGFTHVSKNMLKPTLETTTQNGVTFTKNGNGTYTLNGTASANTSLTIGSVNIEANKEYKLIACPSGGSDSSYRAQNNELIGGAYKLDYGQGAVFSSPTAMKVNFNVRIASGYTCNNLIIKPMITTDTTLTYNDFEPYGMTSLGDHGYFDGELLQGNYSGEILTFSTNYNWVAVKRRYKYNLGDSYHVKAEKTFNYIQVLYVVNGKRIGYQNFTNTNSCDLSIPSNTEEIIIQFSITNGLLVNDIGDITILINGKYAVRVDESGKNLFDEKSNGFNKIGEYMAREIDCDLPKTLSISIKGKISELAGCYFGWVKNPLDADKGYAWLLNNGNISLKSRTDDKNERNYFFVYPGNVETLEKVLKNLNIQLEIGNQATDYTPYEGQTVFIPTSQPLQDGDSISYHVDGSGVEHRKMGVVDLGSLDWNKRSDGSFENTIFSNMPTGTSKIYITICEGYESSDWDTVTANQIDKQITIFHFKDWTYARLAIRDRAYTDASAFKTAMSGKMLVYELATPTDTPLTADQVSELKKLKTYTTETNISTDELASMDVVYYADNDNAEVVGDLQSQILDRDFVATETKMLGWNVPSACPIKNEINGNTFIQRVGRVDLSKLSWEWATDRKTYRSGSMNVENIKPCNNNSVAKIYCYGVKPSNANSVYSGNIGVAVAANKDIYYKDSVVSETVKPRGILYYELETPLTMQIDGNEAIDKVKADLSALIKTLKDKGIID